MAYRRSLTARANLLYQQRFGPSFTCIYRDDNDHIKDTSNNPISASPKTPNYFQQGFLGTRNKSFCRVSEPKSLFRDHRFSIPISYGPVFARYMSAASVGEGAADKIETVSDVVEVLADTTAEAGAVVNEVAIAAADSYFPVAVLQYLIDYVHTITGFNWWASIIVTTLVIRWLALPLMVNQMKATSKFTLLRPQLEEIKDDMQNRGMTPAAVSEGQAQMLTLFKEHGVTPFTPLKGLLIQGPVFVSFFLAISNMVEKVPSFKHGGAFWFTDLTTPDPMYIFPVLMALTFWITVECNAQEGLEGNPSAGTIKNVSRGFAALSIPFTVGFPKAVFCYWITSNFFSLVYGLIQPPSTNQKPAIPFFEMLKKFAAAQQRPLPFPAEASKSTTQEMPSSSVLNQRLKSLEKEVKGKKKRKKSLKR